MNYGLLTTRAGCPVAISVYEGNTADASTLMPQVKQLRDQFGLERLVLVGDRGMISHKAIDTLRSLEGLAWITALKSSQIRALAQGGTLQLGLFDERNLFEFSHPDFPDERLMACRNVDLGSCARTSAQALLEATEKELEKVRARIENGSLAGRDRIGVRVGQVVNKYKVGKHFALTIEESGFKFQRLETADRRRSCARRDLRDPHQRPEETDELGRGGAQLQSARTSRAGVPFDENHRFAYPPHPPSSGRPRACAHLPVHACLLCRVAHARGVARVDVCRRGPGAQKTSRPGRRGRAIRGGARESRHPHTQRRITGPQLSHAPRRTLHHRTQYLRGARRQKPRLDLSDDYDAKSGTTSSAELLQAITV